MPGLWSVVRALSALVYIQISQKIHLLAIENMACRLHSFLQNSVFSSLLQVIMADQILQQKMEMEVEK